MRPRSIGRRLAFQYLFTADLQRFEAVESPLEFFRNQRLFAAGGEAPDPECGFRFDDSDPRRDEAETFAFSLIQKALAVRAESDARIGNAAENWTVTRMGSVERNVIRLALTELEIGETPVRVVIDEAVELAKRFGDRDSAAFVNGIIDRIAREMK